MASLYGGHDYYRRMFELQEKLRKSEEERIRLEERFNVLVQDSRNRHDACINRLRMRYIQYLEEQRTRDERNHKLLAALDKVMNKLALISAKKDRLNVLRKQYEAHLLRVYANRRAPGSVTGDSGIASQNEDKYMRKITAAQSDFAETRNVSSPRIHPPAFHPGQPRSIHASKFDQPAVNGASLSNPPISLPVSAGTSFEYRPASVPQATQDYVSPIGLSSDRPVCQTHLPAITVPDTRPYLQTIPYFDETASRGLQDIPNIEVTIPYDTIPVLSTSQQIRPDDVPISRFFKEHVEAVQAASGLSQFPAGKTARYEEASLVPPQFLSLYHDVGATPPSPRSRIREYDLTDTAAVGPTSTTAKSSVYRIGDVNVASLPGYMDYALASPQGSVDEDSICSLTSDDVNDLIKRDEHMLWTDVDVTRTRHSPVAPGVNNANLDANGRTTTVLEKELDRYISNIRKLHREHGVPSLEELDHEQNTSGDLLNVTLSEDALELSAEERARKEQAPEETGKSLTVADNLLTKMADRKEIAQDKERNGGDKSSAEDRIGHHDAKLEEIREEHETSVKSEIREDAKRSTELEWPREDAKIASENWKNTADDLADVQQRNQEAFSASKVDAKEETSANNKPEISQQNNVQKNMAPIDLVTGEESNIEEIFDIAEKLEPWDVANVRKQVREVCLDNLDKDRETEREVEKTTDAIDEKIASKSRSSPQLVEENGVKRDDESAQDSRLQAEIETRKSDTSERNESRGRNEGNEDAISSPSSETLNETQRQNLTTDDPASQIIEEPGESGDNNDKIQKNEKTTKLEKIVDQSGKTYEYGAEQGYDEDPNQAQQYGQQDPNEQYHYEQNVPYEGTGNEEYDRYADQGYAQEGQEYVEYVDGQYEQYPEDPTNQQDPNAQYDPNNQQYVQDPSQAYDYNYDPNQEYTVDPSQQYDPNQGYSADSNNQTYDYTEQISYDPNQMYDNMAYEQQYTEEQRAVEEVTDVVHEETSKAEETSRSEVAERKSDKPREEDVKTTGQPKKKKDVITSLLDSDTDTTTIERNASNTESDFDFN